MSAYVWGVVLGFLAGYALRSYVVRVDAFIDNGFSLYISQEN